MTLRVLFLLIFSSTLVYAGDKKCSKPFPQAGKVKYYSEALNIPQKSMNQSVTAFYDHWKSKYLVESKIHPGDYKIIINKKGVTVSEAMGYGMLITVQMAGYDPEAKKFFDGLNKFRKRYPSKFNKAFMCWQVRKESKPKKDDSASDGDFDMAAALLMAAEQWQDKAYEKEALAIIEGAEKDLIRKDFSLRLGDWDTDEEATAIRPSDFTTANFTLFEKKTGHKIWKKVREKCYALLSDLQKNYAPETGLVPDFALMTSKGAWGPAKPNFLETKNDGAYYYNSCRVPWRLGASVMLYNSPEAKEILNRQMKWVVNKIPKPKDFKGGYTLNGNPLEKYDEPTFTSPVVVAAMATGNKKWSEDGFTFIKNYKVDYFSDSINLLSMLLLTHNYWQP
jgi:endo-1,4-beta-D-glucanase Y